MFTFILVCLGIVVLFFLALVLSTISMGKDWFISLQVLMGSLRYSKEVDDKLNIVLGKVDAGMYHVVVGQHTIELYNKIDNPDETQISQYSVKPDLEIWIENKYYSYGNIHRMTGGEAPYSIRGKRPSIAIMKQIRQLELSNGDSTKKVKKDKSDPSKIVLG